MFHFLKLDRKKEKKRKILQYFMYKYREYLGVFDPLIIDNDV